MGERFDRFSGVDLEYIYRGLKALIEHGEGVGFHNSQRGHTTYRAGAVGKTDGLPQQDSPEQNNLFQMLSELSSRLKDGGIEELCHAWWYDFSTWKSFCKFALDNRKPNEI